MPDQSAIRKWVITIPFPQPVECGNPTICRGRTLPFAGKVPRHFRHGLIGSGMKTALSGKWATRLWRRTKPPSDSGQRGVAASRLLIAGESSPAYDQRDCSCQTPFAEVTGLLRTLGDAAVLHHKRHLAQRAEVGCRKGISRQVLFLVNAAALHWIDIGWRPVTGKPSSHSQRHPSAGPSKALVVRRELPAPVSARSVRKVSDYSPPSRGASVANAGRNWHAETSSFRQARLCTA